MEGLHLSKAAVNECMTSPEDSKLQSVFITGGNGFVGAGIVRRLVSEGDHVRIMLRPQSDTRRLSNVLNQVEILHGDLKHLESIEHSLRTHPADAVIHAAWTGVAASERDSLSQVTDNITATMRVCELAALTGCRSFLGIGSQAEYGIANDVLTEDTVPNPVTPYGFAKHSTWTICRKICEVAHMRFLWLRLLSVYGPGDDERHMIPSVIRCLLRGEKPKLTRGLQRWDYLYIDDCAAAISAALNSDAEGTFVLGSGQVTTIRDVAEIVRNKINPLLPLGFGDVPDGPSCLNLEANISRLIEATGWRPRVSLNDGLERTIASMRQEEFCALSHSQGGLE